MSVFRIPGEEKMEVNPDRQSPDDDLFTEDLSDATNPYHAPAATYEALCVGLDNEPSKAGKPMWTWTFAIATGAEAGKEFKCYTVRTPAALWKVSEVVCALGLGEPGQKVSFKKSDAIGRACMVTLEDNEFNGRINSSVKLVAKHPKGVDSLKNMNLPKF